jgi:uncharacterized protein (DUF1778 family)
MGKTKVIPVRLDAEAHLLIERAALLTGQTVSGYLRHAAVTAAQRDAGSHPATALARRRVGEISENPEQIEFPMREPRKK